MGGQRTSSNRLRERENPDFVSNVGNKTAVCERVCQFVAEFCNCAKWAGGRGHSSGSPAKRSAETKSSLTSAGSAD